MKESVEENIKILTDYMLELNSDIQRAEEWVNTSADEEMYFALKNVLDKLEELQKENEELKSDLHEITVSNEHKRKEWIHESILNSYISKQRVKDLILNKKEEIIKNSNEIEGCRKTILDEQSLKQLRLNILHRKNEVLFEQIADLQELLHK